MKGPLTEMSGSDINKGTASSASNNHGRSSLVELKSGKVYFKQKCISFEKQSETLQEIVNFRQMLEERIERQAPPLTAIPDDYKPLIAKLAHESDKTLSALSKHIRHELMPTQDEDEEYDNSSALAALPLSAVEAAIKYVVQRNNYGLDGIGGTRAPAALCVWRWEVKEQHRDWLPKNAREKAEIRAAERVQAKQDLLSIFESLAQEERDAILDPKGLSKLPRKQNPPEASKPSDVATDILKGSSEGSKKQQKKKGEDEENDTQSGAVGTKGNKTNKSLDPERAAKEKEKLEKKAAKAEKEKKERDAQNKSRSLLANFFGKPKVPTRAPSKETDSVFAGPSKIQSEFEKTFKTFVVRKDTQLAPVNWFSESKKRMGGTPSVKPDGDVIVIDEEEPRTTFDIDMNDVPVNGVDLSHLSNQDRLRSILSSLPTSANPLRCRLPSKQPPSLKTQNPFSVRDIVCRLSEAEVAGDIPLVRSTLSKLCNRSLLPAKVFIFHEDVRPGYFGTWTRNSRIVGPRSPFAKDVLVFDYNYDSGEEWEQETPGDADDVVDDGEDEDDDGDGPDSDLDSWLVDDDEEPIISLDNSDVPPVIPDLPVQTMKRKTEDGEKKSGKRRKVVIPLVPFAKGPCWESPIAHCGHDLFKPYQMQLFNDTPFPIDPFTFVSTCVEDSQTATVAASSSDGVFVVPSLPERLTLPTNAMMNPAPTALTFVSVSGPSKVPPPPPKTTFPEAHLPYLLEKITALQASSITFLVDSMHRDLSSQKVKKNAIEAKIREVGEKCKEKKVWVIKPNVQ